MPPPPFFEERAFLFPCATYTKQNRLHDLHQKNHSVEKKTRPTPPKKVTQFIPKKKASYAYFHAFLRVLQTD